MYSTLANPYVKNSSLFGDYEIYLALSARKVILSLRSISFQEKVVVLNFLDAQINYWQENEKLLAMFGKQTR